MTKLEEVTRAVCNEADIHLTCAYPECSCTTTPKLVRAAVEALREPSMGMLASATRMHQQEAVSPVPSYWNEKVWQAMLTAILEEG